MSPLPAGSILNLSIGGARERPDDWKRVKNVGFIFLINLFFIERYLYVCLLIFVSFLLFTPPLSMALAPGGDSRFQLLQGGCSFSPS